MIPVPNVYILVVNITNQPTLTYVSSGVYILGKPGDTVKYGPPGFAPYILVLDSIEPVITQYDTSLTYIKTTTTINTHVKIL